MHLINASLTLFAFDRIPSLGYNCHPSLSRTGTDTKTPAENPLFGVLIIIFEVIEWQRNVHINQKSGGACAYMVFASAWQVQMVARF
jgi:hypothetical protein